MQFDSNSTSYDNAPAGPHVARLISIIDLGTQEGSYEGKPTQRRQNLFVWEIPDELREDGKPHTIGKFYTQSVNEKSNLGKDLTSWLGKAPVPPKTAEESVKFTNDVIKPLLGKGCQIVVIENADTGKVKVSSVIGLPKGTTLPKESAYPYVFFDLDAYDEEVFDNLTEWQKNTIMKSPEFAKIMSGDSEEEPEIPF